MSIAQDLVTRMNGKISVQSKLGEGEPVFLCLFYDVAVIHNIVLFPV